MIEKANPIKMNLKTFLIAILALVLVFSAGSMIFVKNLYDKEFPRFDRREFSGYLTFKDISGDSHREVDFKSGENMLRGYIFGEENRKGLIVVAHGIGQGAERYLPETLYFVDHGWQVFAFDGTGSHASEGKGTIGLAQSLFDLEAALAYIQSDDSLNNLPVMLFGHSWGGYSVAAILNSNSQIHAVVSVAGFNSPDELLLEHTKMMLGPFIYLEYPYLWAYQTLLFGNTTRLSAVNGINKTSAPVLIIHGDQDEQISYTGSSIISHRSEITNPNVGYETISAPNRNGHMTLFSSTAALEYVNQKNEEYSALLDQYQGELPQAAKVAFYANVDKSKTSELDAALMQRINDFFESASH